MKFFLMVLSALFATQNALAADWQAVKEAQAQIVPVAETKGVKPEELSPLSQRLSELAGWQGERRSYCPTDVPFREAEAARNHGKAAVVAGVGACVVLSVPCMLGVGAAEAGYLLNEAFTDHHTAEIKKQAQTFCSHAPADISLEDAPHWNSVCYELANNLGYSAVNDAQPKKGFTPVALPPYQVDSTPVIWNYGRSKIVMQRGLMNAQEELRRQGYHVCLSNPQMVNSIESHPDMTMYELVSLVLYSVPKEHWGK